MKVGKEGKMENMKSDAMHDKMRTVIKRGRKERIEKREIRENMYRKTYK